MGHLLIISKMRPFRRKPGGEDTGRHRKSEQTVGKGFWGYFWSFPPVGDQKGGLGVDFLGWTQSKILYSPSHREWLFLKNCVQFEKHSCTRPETVFLWPVYIGHHLNNVCKHVSMESPLSPPPGACGRANMCTAKTKRPAMLWDETHATSRFWHTHNFARKWVLSANEGSKSFKTSRRTRLSGRELSETIFLQSSDSMKNWKSRLFGVIWTHY